MMDVSLKVADLAIVFATLAGPVLAVQAQKWVERGREKHNRRIAIFRTLMATRANSLSPAHVEALNAIPIEFYGGRFKEVVEAWKAYLDYLSQKGIEPAVWSQKRYDLFIELLWTLSLSLRYQFSKVELQREVYSPMAHAEIETQNNTIRIGLAKILGGEAALPLDIRTLPIDADLAKGQAEIQKQLLSWLSGKATVKVELETGPLSQQGA
jgi:hypothetical protein